MLRFFVFENRTVLPDSHHSGIITVSTYRTVNAFLNAFCAGSNFFYQKFWMAGAVQFFCLAISFFMFSSVMESSLTRFALSPSSTFTSSIHSIFSIGLFCPRCLSKTQQMSASRLFQFRAFPLLPESEKILFGLAGT